MAARNKAKMEDLRSTLAQKFEAVQTIPLLIGDVSDRTAIERIVGQTRVIIALNGPYAKLGTPVVEACLSQGTHYCDITGEVQWIRKMVAQHHQEAQRKGIKIVHCCGFDSIPSDLGTAFLADHIQRTTGRPPKAIDNQAAGGAGGLGGGTILSLLNIFSSSNAELKAISDPYCLDPPSSSRGPDHGDSLMPHYSQGTGKWTSFFVMAPINTRIVRRSHALLGQPFGTDFSYRESMQVPNMVAAMLVSILLAITGVIAYFGPLRWLLLKLAPKPGTGPSRDSMEQGHWKFQVAAQTRESPSRTILASVTSDSDPGYLSTSRMVAEAGLCLATQEDELKQANLLQGGILTPASAMGLVLVKRLQAAGFGFNVESDAHRTHH